MEGRQPVMQHEVLFAEMQTQPPTARAVLRTMTPPHLKWSWRVLTRSLLVRVWLELKHVSIVNFAHYLFRHYKN